MSSLIYVVTALCLLGFAFGAALVYVALRDAEDGVATFGVVIFVVSLFGFCFLDEPIMDVQNELAGSDTEYKALLTATKKMATTSAKLKMEKKWW